MEMIASVFSGSELKSEFPSLSNPELLWRSWAELESKPDSIWSDWLLAPGSLTQLLKEKSENQFEVRVTSEEWTSFSSTGLRGLFGPLDDSHRFWSRKVILRGKGEDWVMAHTLVPEHSLFSPLSKILKLKNKPLGEYLFSHPQLLRLSFELSAVADDCWGRRSLFFLHGKPIMVAEFFLPQLVQG